MKKITKRALELLLITSMVFGLYNCSSNDDGPQPEPPKPDPPKVDEVLHVTPKAITFENSAGEATVEVTTTAAQLKAEYNANWLTVTQVAGTKEWKLVAQENKDYDERSTKVTFKAGSLEEALSVTQAARERFRLPYLAEVPSVLELKAYEEAMKSTSISKPSQTVGDFSTSDPNIYAYKLNDDVWEEVAYSFESETSSGYTKAMIFTKQVKLFDDAELVKEFLEKNNFKHSSGKIYRHNTYNYGLMVEKYNNRVGFYIFYEPGQNKAYPTWDAMPVEPQASHIYYHNSKDPSKSERGWKIADVRAYEKPFNPAVDDLEEPEFYLFAEKAKGYRWARGYWFDYEPINPIYKGELERVMYASIDLDKVFYTFDNKKYYITDEFYALLTKSGYEFYADQGTLFFIHDDNKILGVRTANLSDLFDGETCISMQVYRDDVSQLRSATRMSQADQEGLIQRISDKIYID